MVVYLKDYKTLIKIFIVLHDALIHVVSVILVSAIKALLGRHVENPKMTVIVHDEIKLDEVNTTA